MCRHGADPQVVSHHDRPLRSTNEAAPTVPDRSRHVGPDDRMRGEEPLAPPARPPARLPARSPLARWPLRPQRQGSRSRQGQGAPAPLSVSAVLTIRPSAAAALALSLACQFRRMSAVKTRIMYVQRGWAPRRIVRVRLSKTGRTIFYGDLELAALKRCGYKANGRFVRSRRTQRSPRSDHAASTALTRHGSRRVSHIDRRRL